MTSVNGYFTYAHMLDISGYDASNNLVATTVSHYSDNEALSGDPGSSPNENIMISSSSAISNIKIGGDLAGGSFTLDDLGFWPIAVPEIDADSCAGALALLTGVLLIFRDRKNKVAGRA